MDFQVGDAEALAFADDSFDAVLSAIGVMFTADHDRAAAELVRVCRPGGRLGLASWTPTGFVGQMLKTVGQARAAAAGGPAAHPVGDRGGRRRAARRPGPRRRVVHRVGDAAVRLAGGVRGLLPHALRPHVRRGLTARRATGEPHSAGTWSGWRARPTAPSTAPSSATGTTWSSPRRSGDRHDERLPDRRVLARRGRLVLSLTVAVTEVVRAVRRRSTTSVLLPRGDTERLGLDQDGGAYAGVGRGRARGRPHRQSAGSG